MRAPRNKAERRNDPPTLLAGVIPQFDLTGYELDKKTPWTIEDGVIVWHVARIFDPCPPVCPFSDCPVRDQFTHGSRTADFQHVPSGDVPQRIRITVPRWFAGGTLDGREILPMLPHPGMEAVHKFTKACLQFIIRQLLDPDQSRKKIAELVEIDVRTIDRLKAEFVPMPPWPVTLSIHPAMTSFRIDDVTLC